MDENALLNDGRYFASGWCMLLHAFFVELPQGIYKRSMSMRLFYQQY
ncbi:Protein of unknown function, partial [Gryllus bimaculatus]